MLIHETDCTITLNGREFSGHGAYVDPQTAMVYISIETRLPNVIDHQHTWSIPIIVKDWHGSVLGSGFITRVWRQSNRRESYKMASASFQIEGIWYKGRFSPDHGDLCRGTRIRQEKVIAQLTRRLQSLKPASTSG